MGWFCSQVAESWAWTRCLSSTEPSLGVRGWPLPSLPLRPSQRLLRERGPGRVLATLSAPQGRDARLVQGPQGVGASAGAQACSP